MYEERDEIRLSLEALWNAGLGYDRGQVIPWSIIEQATGMTYQSNELKYIVGKFVKRLLKDREIAVRGERGTGIRLLTASEQVRCPGRRERAGRQLFRGAKEVVAVDGASLSDHDRRMQHEQIKALKAERSKVRAGLKSVVGHSVAVERRPMPT